MATDTSGRATASPRVAYNCLLAAIFGEDRDKLLGRKGLVQPPPVKRCKSCGAEVVGRRQGARYCFECAFIPLACDWCGAITLRKRSEMMGGARRGYAHAWCSRNHQARWWGAHHGFGVHPEHGALGMGNKLGYRKHDEAAIWAAHLETGWGAPRLSRLLSIPEGSIYRYLTRKRRALAEGHP